MKQLFITLLLLAVGTASKAQFQEQALALTDKDCYVAGERMWVSVTVEPAGLSRVAYLELADTRGLVTQTMVQLTDGRGWAKLPLPWDMHSGNYQLSVYTRNMRSLGAQSFGRQLVGVVNARQQSEQDHITFLPKAQETSSSSPSRKYKAGEVARISLPRDSMLTIRSLSVVRNPLAMINYQVLEVEDNQDDKQEWTPELEGHIVVARPIADGVVSSRLSPVGKGINPYDGQQQPDGTWHFYTMGMIGQLPLTVEGYDAQGKSKGMELLSPYAQILPRKLPALEVRCDRLELQQRSIGAQQEQALSDWERVDTLSHSMQLLSRAPESFYDMDEYTQFSSVREALREFIMGVSRKSNHGVSQLYVTQADSRMLADMPALVLLDGMPVSNVDDILDYDARLLKYVQVYTGCFTFGASSCHGVIAFITRKGLLSNFTLNEGTRLVRYQFPQQRPDFITPLLQETSTVLWLPQVDDSDVTFTVPSLPGIYQVLLQGTDPHGIPFQSVEEIEVVP